MQQEWDDLDELITDSSVEIDTKSNYNYKLVSKINAQAKCNMQKRQRNTAAVSLIMAGIMLMFIYTSDVKYRVTDLELQVKASVSTIKNNLNFDNFFLGE